MDADKDSIGAFHTSDSDQLESYRAVSLLALFGLLLGLMSPLAIVRPLLIVVPVAAVCVSGLAIARIRKSDGRLVGRGAASLGLCLGIFFAALGPAHDATRQRLIFRQARPIAEQFFATLASGEPHKAMQLTKMSASRQPFDDRLWDYFREDDEARKELRQFVDHPLIRTLLSLGDRAKVRFYDNERLQRSSARSERASLLYAVTYNRGGQTTGKKTSFFVVITLQRVVGRDDSTPQWRVAHFEGGIRPDPM